MEVMVIYVWQCMVVLLYNCICAQWLWSIMNEHATATINPLTPNDTFMCHKRVMSLTPNDTFMCHSRTCAIFSCYESSLETLFAEYL